MSDSNAEVLTTQEWYMAAKKVAQERKRREKEEAK